MLSLTAWVIIMLQLAEPPGIKIPLIMLCFLLSASYDASN